MMIEPINHTPDTTTKFGTKKWKSSIMYEGINELTIVSQFPKTHHMQREYGINTSKQVRYSDGRKIITLEGNIFQKPFSFTATNAYNYNKDLGKEIKSFLKDLKFTRELKNIPNRAINVLKHVK